MVVIGSGEIVQVLGTQPPALLILKHERLIIFNQWSILLSITTLVDPEVGWVMMELLSTSSESALDLVDVGVIAEKAFKCS